jgi:ABC-type branched-subunit amino acid transport system substrate-binding protein
MASLKTAFVVAMTFTMAQSASAAEFTLGQSAALTGPTMDLGTNLTRGIEAYLASAKDLKLKSLDDKYEPKLTEENTKKLIADNVGALLGYVGTPTSKVALPLATSAKKVFFGAFTGAGFIVDSKENPYSFNLRASYGVETEKMVEDLTKKGVKKIAIFVQNDAFGDVGKAGVEKAMTKRNMKIAAEGRYERNTIAVKGGADTVLAAAPEAVILVGAYKPCAAAIKYWKSKGLDVPFVNISFVGSQSLAEQLKGQTKNVYVTQVVPNPWDASVPVVKEYQSAIKGEKEFISLEGYLMAKVMHLAVQKAGADANNPDKLRSAIESINTDVGGLKVKFGADDHQGLDTVYLSKINDDGSFSYVNKID